MTSLLVALALAAAVNPSGHWEGTLDTPQAGVAFQVDLAEADGALVGTITIPQQHLKGLPLTTIVVDGRSITFGARSDQLLAATIADDGRTMAGTFSMETFSFPFTLTRTGDAAIDPPPVSPHIGPELEGEWTGALSDGSAELHLVLTMRNGADGLARGEIVNVDEGGLRIPIAIAQSSSGVTIETSAVAATFTGALNAEGALVGTYHQGPAEVPLTFTRRR